ncbi:AI-2E family transporter [Phytohabitans flavus]|uniref:AI-2E family transporter n=1 Tax=Phytohabitans flavus TaxID=1076124 RepID=UPI001E29E667|nr:AI-2E family transporter [Phytohabitans flavus]
MSTTDLAEKPTKTRGVWESLSWSLRYGAVASGCVLLIAAVLYLVIRLAVLVAPLTLAIIVALLLAALLDPVAAAVRRLHVPDSVAALAAIGVLLAVVVVPTALLWQVTAEQASDLPQQLAQGWDRTREWVIGAGMSEEQLQSVSDRIGERARSAGGSVASAAMGVAEALGAALLALVLLFFLLKDGRRMAGWATTRLPERSRDRARQAGHAGWTALARYAQGTLAVAAIDAVGIGIGLVLIGVPLALPLALLTFIAAFVPVIGATVAGAVAVLVALAANGPVDALLVLIVVVAVQQIEGNLLQPLIMGRALKLHPAVVLIAVTAGGLTAGVAGAVVAVPITAVAYRVWRSWSASGP